MFFPRPRQRAGCFRAALTLLLGLVFACPALAASHQLHDGLLRVQVEDHARGRAIVRHYLESRGLRRELLGVRSDATLMSGSRVRVRGTAAGNVLALDPDGSSNLQATAPATLAHASGVQSVAVIMVNFSDNAVQPMTRAAMHEEVFGTASDFLRENSGGQTWLSGTVFGWFTLPLSKASCDAAAIASLGDQAATAAGADLSAYTRRFYVFPKNACTWAGVADVGGSDTRAWFNGKFDLDNFGHEFGHNLGLMHSHALDCDTGALGDACKPMSYGDAADIMGNLEGHYNGFQKERLGWQAAPTAVTVSGRHLLVPYELGNGVRVLKIPRGLDALGRQTWFYLEYRQPVGFDTVLGYYGTLARGVLVRTGTSGDSDSSYLLDMTPGSGDVSGMPDLWDSALLAGRRFDDPATGIGVSVVSADANGAVVDIELDAVACTRATPLVTLELAPATTAGGSADIGVNLGNRDSAGCAATSFDLAAVLPAGWSGSYAAPTLVVSAGASASTRLTLQAAATAAPGSHAFTVNASCSRGSACAAGRAGSQDVVASSLQHTVATSKPVYRPGETVGLGASLRNGTAPIAAARVRFTVTRPNGSTVSFDTTTTATGTASASFRMNRKKDPPGSYQVRALFTWNGQTATASTSFAVQ